MNLIRSNRHALAVAAAVLAIGAAGCSTPSRSGTSTTTAPEASPPTESPIAEPTGPEAPRPSENGGVAISIPQLPVGGGTEDQTAENQCVSVSWLQPDLLPDNGVTVTGIEFTPPDAFSAGGSCGGVPACNSFTFGAGADSCSVAVKALGTGGSARLTVRGKAVCAPGKESSCQELRNRVSPGSIGLTQPDSTFGSATETPPSPTG